MWNLIHSGHIKAGNRWVLATNYDFLKAIGHCTRRAYMGADIAVAYLGLS